MPPRRPLALAAALALAALLALALAPPCALAQDPLSDSLSELSEQADAALENSAAALSEASTLTTDASSSSPLASSISLTLSTISESSTPSEASSTSHESSSHESSSHESSAHPLASSSESSAHGSAGDAVPPRDKLRDTLNKLATALNKIFAQVEADETLFKAFKQKVMDNEVSKSDVDLSWPAIRSVIDMELATGKKKLDNQMNNFKIDILDAVQRGLESLRHDLQATVTSGYAAAAAAEAAARAKQVERHLKESAAASTGSDSGSRAFENADPFADPLVVQMVKAQIKGTMLPEDAAEVSDLVVAKLAALRATRNISQHDYGAQAMQLLFNLKKALSGNPTLADVKKQVYLHMKDILTLKNEHPIPSVLFALKEMKAIILAALQRLHSDIAASPLAPNAPSSGSSIFTSESAPVAPSSFSQSGVPLPGSEDDSVVFSSEAPPSAPAPPGSSSGLAHSISNPHWLRKMEQIAPEILEETFVSPELKSHEDVMDSSAIMGWDRPMTPAAVQSESSDVAQVDVLQS